MIRYYYRTAEEPSLQTLKAHQVGCWTYAEAPSEHERETLAARFKLDSGVIEDAMDEDEQPRYETEDGVNYLFVRFAYRPAGATNNEIETAPLLFVLSPKQLLTVSPVHLPAVEAFINGRLNAKTSEPLELLLQIVQHASEQYDTYISGTSRQIKAIRSGLRGHGIANRHLIAFVTIEDELNEFLASLQPTNASLQRFLRARTRALSDDQRDAVQDVVLNNDQSIEACRVNLTSISNIRDAYSAIASNNLNRTIEVLTIVTVALALPNLFFGMFGMNVPIPFEHRPWAFFMVLGLSITSVVILALIGRRKRII
jgi:magnesium transporter